MLLRDQWDKLVVLSQVGYNTYVNSQSINTRNNYNRMSRYYDLIAAPSEKRFKDIGIEMLDVQAGMRVLELGCGTGYSLARLSQLTGEEGMVVGFDLSEGMLRQAQKRFKKIHFTYKPFICQADLLSSPIENKCFDRIFLSFILEIFPDEQIPGVLEICKNLLNEDGQMCVVSIQYEKSITIRIYEWITRVMPNVVDCRPIELKQKIQKVGFNIINQRREKMWGLPIEIISVK